MPAEFWTEAARLFTSGLLVAMCALTVGLVARGLRPKGEPLLPRWKPWRVPWGGLEVLVAFLVVALVLPGLILELLNRSGFYTEIYGANFPTPTAKDVDPEQLTEANTLRMLWANVVSLPLMLGLLWVAAKSLYPKWKPEFVGRGSIAGKVWLAVVAWFVIAPSVLVLNAIVNAISLSLGFPPEQHSLTKFGNRPLGDQIIFLLEACIAAPIREELLCRGILMAWCIGRMKIPDAGVSTVTAARPWFVMIAACAIAVSQAKSTAPVIFALLLVVGLAVLWRFTRTGSRRARAVYGTAALFAVVHPVWPNPIPLFLLGLGLGWLAVRTNGILVPVIVHGLFNAVSAVFVLRGAAPG